MIRLMIDDMYPSMPWAEIDAVVFDVGNVLLGWTAKEQLNRIVPECPEYHEELARRVFSSPYWCMRDRGSASVEEVSAAMCKTAPALEPYVRRIMREWVYLPAIPEGVNALKTCKEHGVKLYALTNFADEEFAIACKTNSFFSLFDDHVVSGRLHLVKPGLEIYRYLIEKFQLDPARTLFIDDSPANIEAALESGWQALCYNHKGKLEQFFG